MSLLEKASLIVTPNAYKESVLYSVVPNTTLGDMDVVRATTATRVNGQGLIEVVPKNLFLRSEQFENASWLAGGSGAFVITTNSTTAPNGTLTADKFIAPLTNQTIRQNLATINTSYTLSVYLKTNSGTKQMRLFINDTEIQSVINVTANWQRFTLSGTTGGVLLGSGRAGFSNIDILNESSFVYAWGAQLEVSSTATTYFPTTDRLNIPRIDYTNGTCPSLLVEPQRTNLLTYSNSFIVGTGWSTAGSTVTRTPNFGISPDGTQNSTRIQFSTSGLNFFKSITASNASASIYVKGTAGQTINFYIGSTDQLFTLNGQWQRIERFAISVTQVSLSTFNSATARDIEIYGAQLEVGSYASSYIPTVASTVTRNADVISKTGISSLIGQTEGTLFTDFKVNSLANFGTLISVNSNSLSNFIYVTVSSSGQLRVQVFNGLIQADIYSSVVVGNRYKLAFGYKTNDFVLYINGILIGSDVSGTTFSGTTLDRFDYNITIPTTFANSSVSINSSALYKTRLTNSELAQLTTL